MIAALVVSWVPAQGRDDDRPPEVIRHSIHALTGTPGVSYEELLGGDSEVPPLAPVHVRLQRVRMAPGGGLPYEATEPINLLWVTEGSVLVSDELGDEQSYERGSGLIPVQGALLALRSAAESDFLAFTVGPLSSEPKAEPLGTVLADADLSTMPGRPARVVVARVIVAPGGETSAIDSNGPLVALVESGEVLSMTSSGLELAVPSGEARVVPPGTDGSLRNATLTPATVLLFGVVSADAGPLIDARPSPEPSPVPTESPSPTAFPSPSVVASTPTPSTPVATPDTVSVPQVRGVVFAKAMQTLQRAGLKIGHVTDRPSTDTKAGFVLRTTPSAGDRVSRGRSVDILLSSGPPRPVVTPAPVPTPRRTPHPTPRPTPQPPSTPSGVRAAVTGTSSITVSWRSAARATKYQVRRGSSSYTVGGTRKTFSGLASGARYCFQVRAIARSGPSSDWSRVVCARTKSLPDIQIMDPGVPSSMAAGASYRAIARFRVVGSVPSVRVTIVRSYPDSTSKVTTSTVSTSVGGRFSVEFFGDAKSGPWADVTIVLDQDDIVNETNEANNRIRVRITVQ